MAFHSAGFHAMMTNRAAHTRNFLVNRSVWWIAPGQPHLPRRSCQDIPTDRPGHFCIGDLNAYLAVDLGSLK